MQTISLNGKVILITGGSRGMGREMALAFTAAGAQAIVLTAAMARDETREQIAAELESVAGEVRALGGQALTVYADVTVYDDCAGAVAKTIETFGALHVLVNNAGKSQRYHGARDIPFWETDPDGWRDVITTNVVGPYYMARAAVPHMLAGGGGRIINISKEPDQMHVANAGAYGPSKACLEAESVSWAEELVDRNVTVNCIDPGGAVNTTFGRGMIRNMGLDPTVIRPLATWLASDESAGYTGCRFDAKHWDASLAPAQAAERCRESPLFPVPTERRSPLERAWKPRSRRA